MRTLKVENSLHKRFKLICVRLGMSMFVATEEALREWLARREPKPGQESGKCDDV